MFKPGLLDNPLKVMGIVPREVIEKVAKIMYDDRRVGVRLKKYPYVD
jgi:hypothetical protein